MDEKERKRIAEKVGFWDKLKVSLTPGDISERQQKLKDIADANERNAELEAVKKRRLNAGQ